MANVPFMPEMPTRWPLVAEPSNRDDTTDKDARLVNGYIERHGNDTWVYRRPGYARYAPFSTVAGHGRGVYNWEGDFYGIVSGTLFRNGVGVGFLSDNNRPYSFSSILGAVPKLVMSNGLNAYKYTVAGGLSAMGGVQPPTGNVPGWAYVDGTLYYMLPNGQIFGSGINDVDTWDVLNYLTAQIEPDKGVCLAKQLVYVVAFKQWTTEIFYDRGNATGSPLAPVQGALVSWGCYDADSVKEIDGKLFWLASTRAGALQIVSLENLKPEVISTTWIEKLLLAEANGPLYAWNYKGNGHSFYVLTLTDRNLTLAYDLKEKLWTQWQDTNGNYLPIVSSANAGTICLLQHATEGDIYAMLSYYNTDDGALTTWELYTPIFDAGIGLKKVLNTLRISGDITPNSIIQVRCNDYDYDATKWTNYRTLDMSGQNPMLVNCGTFRRRAYHFKHRLDTALRVTSVDLQLSAGTL